MAIFLPEARLLVLQVPGTASTALERALATHTDARVLDPKHGTLSELVDQGFDVGDVDEVVCVIRNPYEMLFAEWHRSRTRWVLELHDPSSIGGWPLEKRLEIAYACALEFSEYVTWLLTDDRGRPISVRLYEQFTRDADQVFRVEEMSRLEMWMSDRLGARVRVPLVNSAVGKSEYWRHYSTRARHVVEAACAHELDEFAYTFGFPYPFVTAT